MPQLTISNYQLYSYVMEPAPGSGNIEDVVVIDLSGTPPPGEIWSIVHIIFVPDGQPLNRAVLNQETLTCERYRSGLPILYYMIKDTLGSGGVQHLYVDYDPTYSDVRFVAG